MKIAVIHSSLNLCGGAERLCVIMINAIRKAGNEVTLATVDKTNWPLLKRKYGLECKVDHEIFLIPNTFETASISSRIALTLSSFLIEYPWLKLRNDHDLIINTSGELAVLAEDISYINAVPMRMAFEYPEILPLTNSWWRSSSKLYDRLLKAIDMMHRNTILVTNSKFNETIIHKRLGRHASVIYPPVNVELFKPSYKNGERRNLVITVSRFRQGKNLNRIPEVAKMVKNSRFLIIGPADKSSETTIAQIRRTAKELDVQDRVELLTNQPLSTLLRMLGQAKVLLHTQSSEAFGMSIVESMAAGCVPVVPRNGGPWFDLLNEEQGRFGYSYLDTEEAADFTKRLIDSETLRAEISARAFDHSDTFASSIFEQRFLELVNQTHYSKID
jgi:glycosyltransferase involved in cell wall biosynthesis